MVKYVENKEYQKEQVKSLLAFKASGNGDGLGSWVDGTDPCSPAWAGLTCPAGGVVTVLDLSAPAASNWAHVSGVVDPTAEVCAALAKVAKDVKFDGKPICMLKACSAKGVTLACDNFAVLLLLPPHATMVTDTFSFDAVLDLCPGASKPMSIALDFKDTGMAASGVAKAPAVKWNKKFTSDEKVPVSIPIATVGIAEVDAKVIVGIAANPGHAIATISVDICATVHPLGSYCGAALLPGSLPGRLALHMPVGTLRRNHFKISRLAGEPAVSN